MKIKNLLFAMAVGAVLCPVCHAAKAFPQLYGSGTEESPYLIYTVGELKHAAEIVRTVNWVTENEVHFLLMNDLTLNEKVLKEDGTLADNHGDFEQWEGFGNYSTGGYGTDFRGIFDGGGHTIYGLYVNRPDQNGGGFIPTICGNGQIRNLTIRDSYFCAVDACGAFAGLIQGGGTSGDAGIFDCVSYATVVGTGATHSTGGVVGSASGYYSKNCTISNCHNYGRVSACSVPNEWDERWNCSLGGVVGVSSGARVVNCNNYGNVELQEWGIVGGVLGGANGSANVTFCENRGSVISTRKSGVSIGGIVGSNSAWVGSCVNYVDMVSNTNDSMGGIAGEANWNAGTNSCINYGNIVGNGADANIGGIVGHARSTKGSETKVGYCENHGSVTSNANSIVGGIAGNTNYATITGCVNRGAVNQGNSPVGGITGTLEYHSSVNGSSNYADITGLGNTGGIVGEATGSVSGCRNFGTIECKTDGEKGVAAAGIAAYMQNGSVQFCANMGNVMSRNYAGGIVGRSYYNYTLINGCYNAGKVTSYGEWSTGGIAAFTVCNISLCYNMGEVTNLFGGNTGGIVGTFSASKISNCYNAAPVTAGTDTDAVVNAGPILGLINERMSGSNMKDCHYLENSFTFKGENHKSHDINPWWTSDNAKSFTREMFGTSEFVELMNKNVENWGPEYFVGYIASEALGRPVINRNIMEVVTASGDTVPSDFGRPNCNMITYSDDTTVLNHAWNVCVPDSLGAPAIERLALYAGMPYRYTGESIKCNEIVFENDTTGSGTYRSVVLPFDINPSDFGINALLPMDFEAGILLLKRWEENDGCIPANTPFLYENTADVGVELTVSGQLKPMDEMNESGQYPVSLTGVYEQTVFESNPVQSIYLFSDDSVAARVDSIECKPFSALLRITGSNDEAIQCAVIGESTGIGTEAMTTDTKQALYFSIEGRKVDQNAKGMVIKVDKGTASKFMNRR